jgi:hypothetical protein
MTLAQYVRHVDLEFHGVTLHIRKESAWVQGLHSHPRRLLQPQQAQSAALSFVQCGWERKVGDCLLVKRLCAICELSLVE